MVHQHVEKTRDLIRLAQQIGHQPRQEQARQAVMHEHIRYRWLSESAQSSADRKIGMAFYCILPTATQDDRGVEAAAGMGRCK